MEKVTVLDAEHPKMQAARANIASAEKVVAKYAAYTRLQNNDDYKLVIEDGYLEEEAKRVCEILVEPTIANREVISNLIDEITAIRKLKTHLDIMGTQAWAAKKVIKDEEELIESIENGSYQDPTEED